MGKWKRVIGFCLCLLLFMDLTAPTAAFAETGSSGKAVQAASSAVSGEYLPYEGARYSLTYEERPDGTIAITGYIHLPVVSQEDKLVLPDMINGKTVTEIGSHALAGGFFTGELILPKHLKIIGDYAFRGCCEITGAANLPVTVSQIGIHAFSGMGITSFAVPTGNKNFSSKKGLLLSKNGKTLLACPGAKSGKLTIPRGVTAIGDYAFYVCDQLTGPLTIPGSVQSIGNGAFTWCDGFTGALTIPSSIKSIGNDAFYGCSGFTGALTISDGVQSIGDEAFSSCQKLSGTVRLPASVTFWGENVFRGTQISNITVDPKNLTYSAQNGLLLSKDGTELLYCPPEMKGSLAIPNSVTFIDNNACPGCEGLTGTLKIPNGVQSIGNYAFYGCSGFTGALTIPEGVQSIGNEAFYWCSGFTGALTIPGSVQSIGSDAFWGCSGFTGSLTISEGVQSIGSYAFGGCSGFTGPLIIPSSVETIRQGAFWGCSGTITLGCHTKNILGALAGNNFSSISVSPDNPWYTSENGVLLSKDKTQLYAYPGGRGGSLIIPDQVTDIKNWACSVLGNPIDKLIIPNGVKTIGNCAFLGNTFHCDIILPDSVHAIGEYAFDRNTGELSFFIGRQVNYIGANAFQFANQIDDTIHGFKDSYAERYAVTHRINFIPIPTSGKLGSLSWAYDEPSGKLSIIGSGSIPDSSAGALWQFYRSSTTKLYLGSGITGIGKNAFADFELLESVQLPECLQHLSNTAFSGCRKLKDIYFCGDVPMLTNAADAPSRIPFDGLEPTVYFMPSAAYWDQCSWINCTLQPFTGKKVTLTLFGNHENAVDRLNSLFQGTLVDLKDKTADQLNHVYQFTSAANLVAWNTSADGSGKSYRPDEIVPLQEALSLYAQWDNHNYQIYRKDGTLAVSLLPRPESPETVTGFFAGYTQNGQFCGLKLGFWDSTSGRWLFKSEPAVPAGGYTKIMFLNRNQHPVFPAIVNP